ncbi:CopG family transcriptional regulator [Acidovorax sp. NCPPB 4044]|uniref:CopG family transcriptional regulator n=1 Tax=Acidovorax sp. NCPPB 4044 TaxID=2940490 RepID=UPI002303D630|nr:CopG family transcriptional regulator [Acidovorax sp. NCPPB 4044]MDA8520188.1 CopG family transcriptional regulator [Acidovorax sp. NCPPB 4044]
MSRSRLNIFIEPEHARRLEDVSTHRGMSKSSIIAAALASFLSPDAMDQREAAMAKRLDRLSRQFDRLERDQSILIETVALYVRHYLTLALPVPEGQQEAMRAQGRARYAQFIEQLARHIQRGRSMVREIHEDIGPAGAADAGGDTPVENDAP